jgi:hypothetical protein
VKVRILLEISDGAGKLYVGMICDRSDEESARWIKAGFAELVADQPEATTLKGGEEQAVLPPGRKR